MKKNPTLPRYSGALFKRALDDPVDKVKAFDAGGVDYITKPSPFKQTKWSRRVETHLTLRMMQQQLRSQIRSFAAYRDHLQELVNDRTQNSRRQYPPAR